MSRGGVPVAALPVRIRHRAVPCPTEVARSRPCPSASGIGPCHVPWRCPGRGIARPKARPRHSGGRRGHYIPILAQGDRPEQIVDGHHTGPSASGIGPCHVPRKCPDRGIARPRSRVLHSVVLRIRVAFFCRCTRSDDRVVTLYVNRHFNPINRTRSRPSNETLFAVASSRFSIAALYAVASSRRMKSDHHEVIFSLFQAGRRSCSATYVYSPCPCRTLWPVEELLF